METKTKTVKPKAESKGYAFDEKLHAHTLDGKALMGVTTVLSVINKSAFLQWAANMAVESISNNLETNPESADAILKNWAQVLTNAKVAHRVKKDIAADWGTLLHKAIEEWIKEEKVPEDLSFEGLQGFVKFLGWAQKEKVKFLESEKHVWSKELWVGGIADGIATINNEKYLFDIKTSTGIYPTMWAQLGAYHLCLQEMGEHKDIKGYLIINLKKDGKMDMAISNNLDFNQQFFKNTLALYKSNQEAEKMKLVKE